MMGVEGGRLRNFAIKPTALAACSFAVFSLIVGAPNPASAEQICVEEAAGVCLKYRTVEPDPAPTTRARPAPAAPKPSLPATAEAKEEAELDLSKSEYREVQGGLRKAGHYKGALDGVVGPGSRGALRAWQAEAGYDVTGYLTFDQVLALRDIARGRTQQAAVAPAAPAPAPAPAVEVAPSAQPEVEAAPAGPAHPLPGQVYSEDWGKSIAFAVGDMIARLERTGDDTADLQVRFNAVNQQQFSFKDDCEVPVTGSFSCNLRGFEGQLLFISGELPNVSIDGKDVSFW
ncbi:MAG: peptidoglycan-binding domain-containing protein [Pseudomonadota bacterium]